ncbi:hypothetical protein ASF17_14140 [Frigoribacterium sp. Leaf263]|uniref:alpha/beta hydrolase n=1 Tax=Frigoribacterium sp. Leaf263 TaxID=1736313 RepID=UPI000729E30E|nr:alpha/beta hydrolase [Frigoribacterium sp. Leaf263]KQO80437.1 hypothetical protein ASF17_14140 [Frigoribacterium sp. Leaf263]
MTLVLLLQAYLVRHQDAVGFILILALIGVLSLAPRIKAASWRLFIRCVATASIAAEAVWFGTGWNWLYIAAHIGVAALALAAFVLAWQGRTQNKRTRAQRMVVVGMRTVGMVSSGLAVMLIGAVVITDLSVRPAVYALQKAADQVNSFDSNGPSGETALPAGTTLTRNIEYGTQFPNSFLDIYSKEPKAEASRPTYVFIHGGGWIAGSKSMGDPNAAGSSFALGNGPIIDAGYNVVSLDYALAPGAPYPTQVQQVSQAVAYLKEHADQYGLDMSRVVIAGSSAGGQLAGQFANIETNPAYAEQIGIDPVLDKGVLRAVVLDSAAIDLARTGRTELPSPQADFLFSLSLRAYVGQPQNSTTEVPLAREADMLAHVTTAFPPAFIADGNDGTFPDQAKDLGVRLTTLGVRNVVDIPAMSNGLFGHGYMAGPSRETDRYNSRKVAFLAEAVG